MYIPLVKFKEIEAWILLFALEESHAGSARIVYDSWFNGLVDKAFLYMKAAPIDLRLRVLLAARMPLSASMNFQSTAEVRARYERYFTDPVTDLTRDEGFALACDCLRINHGERDQLRAGIVPPPF